MTNYFIYENDTAPESSVLFDIILFFIIFPYLFCYCTEYIFTIYLLLFVHIYLSIMRYVNKKRVVWDMTFEPIALFIAIVIIHNKCYIIGGMMFIVHLYRLLSGERKYNYVIDSF